MEELSRDELIERIEALAPEFEKVMRQFGAHEPDWGPLELVFGSFMFMGYCDGKRMYKHKFTRRYLHLDDKGRAYRWLGETRRYERIPLEKGIAHVFEDGDSLLWLDRDDSGESRESGPTWDFDGDV